MMTAEQLDEAIAQLTGDELLGFAAALRDWAAHPEIVKLGLERFYGALASRLGAEWSRRRTPGETDTVGGVASTDDIRREAAMLPRDVLERMVAAGQMSLKWTAPSPACEAFMRSIHRIIEEELDTVGRV